MPARSLQVEVGAADLLPIHRFILQSRGPGHHKAGGPVLAQTSPAWRSRTKTSTCRAAALSQRSMSSTLASGQYPLEYPGIEGVGAFARLEIAEASVYGASAGSLSSSWASPRTAGKRSSQMWAIGRFNPPRLPRPNLRRRRFEVREPPAQIYPRPPSTPPSWDRTTSRRPVASEVQRLGLSCRQQAYR